MWVGIGRRVGRYAMDMSYSEYNLWMCPNYAISGGCGGGKDIIGTAVMDSYVDDIIR